VSVVLPPLRTPSAGTERDKREWAFLSRTSGSCAIFPVVLIVETCSVFDGVLRDLHHDNYWCCMRTTRSRPRRVCGDQCGWFTPTVETDFFLASMSVIFHCHARKSKEAPPSCRNFLINMFSNSYLLF
jgi:hypothetical protein